MPEPAYISPKSVLRVREARGETQREFAEHLTVSYATVSQWERGELTLSAKHADLIQELIPAEVSTEEVIELVDEVEEWDAIIPPAERGIFEVPN